MQKEKTWSFPWQELLNWYIRNGRHTLPWRDYTFQTGQSSIGSSESKQKWQLLYRVWLSEILLQQTQASRVVDFFNRIIERFPTIKSLAETHYEEFFPYYQWLGYYSRARNMLQTAKIVHEKHNWIFPEEKHELIKLPGVWPYTAEAIQAFGYGIPTLSWDTNLEKVFARYYHGTKDKRLSSEEKEWVQEDLISFLNQDWKTRDGESEGDIHTKTRVRAINNALMDFAALMDLKNPENINWEGYIFRESKFYKTKGEWESYTQRQIKTFPTPDATIIVTLHKDHKIYYSEDTEHYEPFILAPSLTRNTREYVKSHFLEKYNLHLSVRPPHKKWFSENGKPYIAVNAQIQMGKHLFTEHKKNKKQ